MATTVTVPRTLTLRGALDRLRSNPNSSSKSHKFLCVSFAQRQSHTLPKRCRINWSPYSSSKISPLLLTSNFLPFASHGEATETETHGKEQQVQASELQVNIDGAVVAEADESEGDKTDAKVPDSAILASLQAYKEALSSTDDSKVAEIETFLKSFEDEKIDLERKAATLSDELSYEKERILRISADFDNFRKRTERERLSLATNAQGEVVENLLPVLDNFERAKAQIKVENDGEEKINNSYQSIYKQFVEILGSLGVVPVETVGTAFDPMLHEAIMREDSTQFEEGIIIQEFRKGLKLGDRLLRPSMVKVSAGPGPAKCESVGQSKETEGGDGTSDVENRELESTKEQ